MARSEKLSINETSVADQLFVFNYSNHGRRYGSSEPTEHTGSRKRLILCYFFLDTKKHSSVRGLFPRVVYYNDSLLPDTQAISCHSFGCLCSVGSWTAGPSETTRRTASVSGSNLIAVVLTGWYMKCPKYFSYISFPNVGPLLSFDMGVFVSS